MEPSLVPLTILGAGLALGGRGYLRFRASRALRHAEPGGDCYSALEAFGRDLGVVLGGGLTVVGILGFGSLAPPTPIGRAGLWLGMLLIAWWIYRGFMKDQRQLVVAYLGTGWDAPIHRALAALTLGPILGVPLCAAALAIAGFAITAAAGRPEFGPAFAPLAVYPAFFVWGVWANAVIRRHFREPAPLPAAVRGTLETRLDPQQVATMAVLPDRSASFYNAVALPSQTGPQIWISESLLAELSEEEAVATLLHEHSHVAHRDDWQRAGWTLGLHAVGLGAAWGLGFTPGLVSSTLGFAVAFFAASTAIGQRHELRADAAALQHGFAEAMGRALATLHRLNAVPSEAKNEGWMTHPLLRRRLEALGVELDASLVAQSPSGTSSRT